MNSIDSNQCDRMPVLGQMDPRLAVFVVLLVMLVSVAGCQPGARPAIEADQDVRPVPARTALPASSETSSQPTATTPDLRPAEFPLSQFLRFGHLTTEDGLSNSTAWSLMKDSQGYLWIATFDGLNRYDGYDFTVYQHDPDNPHSISSSFTRTVFEDSNGDIWIGTTKGFNRFDPSTEEWRSNKS